MPILTITVVLRTVQIAKSRISFSQVFSVSLKAALKGVALKFSKITRRVDGDQFGMTFISIPSLVQSVYL